MIVGVDEVGRGCLAGPVCVAAVALEDGLVEGLADSKILDANKRAKLAYEIKTHAIFIGIGWAHHDFIDKYGLTAALKNAARQALSPFGRLPELILLDGNSNYIDDERVATLVDGDAKVPLISAASIVAKVARDNYMAAMSRRFPQYGFETHVGYGTPKHRSKLLEVGPCNIHRLSFAPLKALSL